MGENIGAAARAMLNFGLTDLRLVAPRDGWPNARAESMSAGAFEIMPQPRVFESLAEAAADLHHLYATTARRRDLVKPVFTPLAAMQDIGDKDGHAGFVFGPERTGLENDDIAQCHSIINIPTNPDFSSLNLGQSVLLVAATFGQTFIDAPSRDLPHGDSFPVEHAQLEALMVRLESELEAGGFFQTQDLRPTMVRNIRAVFTRADLTDQETRTLHGVISTLIGKKKAALD